MNLTGELKEKVEKTENKEEAKKTIEAAERILDDAELDQISGGVKDRWDVTNILSKEPNGAAV